ncbi:YlxR family protein [Pseudolysinimonas sp.]|uniref:YlxR family protein n=1 Tax=Pseudolysinimonas sp. TaxID=2680009 RepID=UPI003F8044E8
MEPVRTCLGCRQRAPRSSLVRVVARDGRVAVDAAARLPGRGAWLHRSSACVDKALQRKAFGRALREADLDATGLREEPGLDMSSDQKVETAMDQS